MGRLANVRRINTQDFSNEDQEVVAKIAEVVNFFMDDVVNFANGNVNYENLSKNLVTINLSVDSSGTPVNVNSIETGIINPTYLSVKRVINITNRALYPSGVPLISYTETGSTRVNLDNVTNLAPNNTYNIVIEIA